MVLSPEMVQPISTLEMASRLLNKKQKVLHKVLKWQKRRAKVADIYFLVLLGELCMSDQLSSPSYNFQPTSIICRIKVIGVGNPTCDPIPNIEQDDNCLVWL